MAVPRFYAGPAPLAAGTLRLSPPESHHAKATRRLTAGDEVVLFDGLGGEGHGRIVGSGGPALQVDLARVTHRDFDCAIALTLAVCMPKGPRQDFLVEKCTELGVAAIWPMLCQRSVFTPSQSRLAKWRRTAIEACKQSQRAWLPELAPARSFPAVLDCAEQFQHAYLADRACPSPATTPATRGQRVLVLIGPEGGLTGEEVAAALRRGMATLQLGETILRTETAAIASAVKILLQIPPT